MSENYLPPVYGITLEGTGNAPDQLTRIRTGENESKLDEKCEDFKWFILNPKDPEDPAKDSPEPVTGVFRIGRCGSEQAWKVYREKA